MFGAPCTPCRSFSLPRTVTKIRPPVFTRQSARGLLAAALASFAAPVTAASVQVAVAANFATTLQQLRENFEADTGHAVSTAIGSSGKLFAQIHHGAPFEVFLSADQDKPARLESQGLAIAGSRFTYAVGRLALWRPAGAPRQGLLQGNYRKLALANPRLAPYGQAARDVLQALNLTDHSRSRQVLGENVAQAFQFVASGNAELGFVAMAQLQGHVPLRPDTVWQVPAELHRPIRQDAVLLRAGRDNPAARQLLTYLQSAAAAKLLRRHGYEVPP